MNPRHGKYVFHQVLTQGIVSQLQKFDELGGKFFLVHSAAVNPGNSGGPLLDEYGQVVGIVTRRTELEGVNLAIPAETIRSRFREFSR